MMLTAIRISCQMLSAVLEPAHGIIHPLRKPAQRHLFTAQQSFISETATDVGGDDPNTAVSEPEALAKAGLNRMRELCRRDERKIPQPEIAISNDASAFHWKHAMTRGSDFPGDGDGGIFGYIFDLAVFSERDDDVVAPLVMNEWRAGLTGRKHIDHDRQFLEFECNRGRNVFRFSARRRHAHRDHFSDIAYLLDGEDWFDRILGILERRRRDDRPDAAQILCGEKRRPKLFRGGE